MFERPRVPIDVNIMVTTKCTTNCCYCYAKRKFDYELSSTEIINIIENCYNLGVVNLNLTGGDILQERIGRRFYLQQESLAITLLFLQKRHYLRVMLTI